MSICPRGHHGPDGAGTQAFATHCSSIDNGELRHSSPGRRPGAVDQGRTGKAGSTDHPVRPGPTGGAARPTGPRVDGPGGISGRRDQRAWRVTSSAAFRLPATRIRAEASLGRSAAETSSPRAGPEVGRRSLAAPAAVVAAGSAPSAACRPPWSLPGHAPVALPAAHCRLLSPEGLPRCRADHAGRAATPPRPGRHARRPGPAGRPG